MSKILFTPIGMTDPITHGNDGSMLHICRVYKPDKVILYMSAEVMEYHKKDNRYVYCLEQLMKKIGKNMEIEYIFRPELKEVQEYDIFYKDFQMIINNILDNIDEESELLLNVASGTPAMKSALLILSVLYEYKLRAIQVETPIKRSNSPDKAYDVEENWKQNKDNSAEFRNRCKEPKMDSFSILLTKDNIRKLIESYDYEAALALATGIKEHISKDGLKLLEIGSERLKLNKKRIDELEKDISYDIIPIKEEKERTVVEYALCLCIKSKKGEYADFIRALTPIITDLTEMILKKQCGIDINDYSYTDKKGVRRFDRNKLDGTKVQRILNDSFSGFKPGGFVATTHMEKLIRYCSNDRVLEKNLDEMEKVEQTVRNLSAHEIVSVTPEWIKTRSGVDVKRILGLIKYFIKKAGIEMRDAVWNSYDEMNRYICKELEK